MEILINPLIEFVSANNTILDIEQIEKLYEGSIKNKSIWKAINIYNEKVELIKNELNSFINVNTFIRLI